MPKAGQYLFMVLNISAPFSCRVAINVTSPFRLVLMVSASRPSTAICNPLLRNSSSISASIGSIDRIPPRRAAAPISISCFIRLIGEGTSGSVTFLKTETRLPTSACPMALKAPISSNWKKPGTIQMNPPASRFREPGAYGKKRAATWSLNVKPTSSACSSETRTPWPPTIPNNSGFRERKTASEPW